MSVRYALLCAVLVLNAGVARPQSADHGESCFTENYHFTGHPAPGEIRPVDPVVAELREIQNTTLAILRKANFAGDYEAALAAAAQAVANAQLIGTLEARPRPPQTSKPASGEAPERPAIFLIALKDESVQAASSYWTDERMLHYITLKGAHEQVRLDLVDRRLSSELNRARKLEFGLEPKRPAATAVRLSR